MYWLRWVQFLPSLNEIVFLTNHFNIKSTEVSNIQYKIIRTRFLNGQFDFNTTPLSPPVTKVVINSKPTNRASWDPNGKEGCVCVTGHQSVECVQIMRWWISNLRKLLLHNLGSVASCYVFILVLPHPPFLPSNFLTRGSAPYRPNTPHLIWVFLLHHAVLLCLMICHYGMCNAHKSQWGRGSATSWTTATLDLK